MKNRQSKRPILLLEVLIAFFFIVVAIFPLVGPHVFIYKSQRQFIDKIGLDRVVNEIYVDVLTELHENRIYLFDILEQKEFEIDPEKLRGLPFKGSYRFKDDKKKKNDTTGRTLYVIKATFFFTSKLDPEKKYEYAYDFVLDNQSATTTPLSEEEAKGEEE